MRVLELERSVLKLLGALALVPNACLLLALTLLVLALQHLLARRGQIVGRQLFNLSVTGLDGAFDEPIAVLFQPGLLHVTAAIPFVLVGLARFSTLRAAALGVAEIVCGRLCSASRARSSAA